MNQSIIESIGKSFKQKIKANFFQLIQIIIIFYFLQNKLKFLANE